VQPHNYVFADKEACISITDTGKDSDTARIVILIHDFFESVSDSLAKPNSWPRDTQAFFRFHS